MKSCNIPNQQAIKFLEKKIKRMEQNNAHPTLVVEIKQQLTNLLAI